MIQQSSILSIMIQRLYFMLLIFQSLILKGIFFMQLSWHDHDNILHIDNLSKIKYSDTNSNNKENDQKVIFRIKTRFNG